MAEIAVKVILENKKYNFKSFQCNKAKTTLNLSFT
jgi:hypothetical protein